MSFVYTPAKTAIMKGEIDFQEAGDDIRVALVMSNTTADTEEDAALMNTFADLDEYDGASYARQSLGTQAVNEDLPNDRSEFDAVDSVFSSLGVGARQAVGLVVYKHVTNDADSIPIAFIDTGGFPFDGNGGDVTIQWNAEGILQLT